MIVVLLLLPRIKEFIEKMAVLTPTGSLVTAINSYFGTQDRATVAIYLIAIAAVIAIFAIFTVRFSVSLMRPYRRTFGYPTKHDVVLTRDEPPPIGAVEGSTSPNLAPDDDGDTGGAGSGS
jgi:hypothetical protein